MVLDGRAESTRLSENVDSFLPGQKREPYWWLSDSARSNILKVKVREEVEEQFVKNEYDSSFNSNFEPNLTKESIDAPIIKDTSFPIGLNPGFDLQAFLQVKISF